MYLSFCSVKTYAIIGPIIGIRNSSVYALFLLSEDNTYKTLDMLPICNGTEDISIQIGVAFEVLGRCGRPTNSP